MKIVSVGTDTYVNLATKSNENNQKINSVIKNNYQNYTDITEISPESKAIASNDIFNNLHTGLTLERVKFLLTPRI